VEARSAAIVACRVAAYGLAAVAVAILANTAVDSCQGGDKGTGPAAAGTRDRSPAAAPAGVGATAGAGTGAGATAAPGTPSSVAVPPQVAAAQLRALSGRWLSTTHAKDYFVFRADGTGAWMARGRALWRGEVIPTGRGAFRLAWQTTMPGNAAYWHVTLLDGGNRLLFDGTRQVYRKV
jgi:hypothetical protein